MVNINNLQITTGRDIFLKGPEYKSILLLGLAFEAHTTIQSLVDAGYPVDTLFSMALQCQVKDAFSPI